MTSRRFFLSSAFILTAGLANLAVFDHQGAPHLGAAEPQKGPGGRNAGMAADRDVFHYLLEHHKEIRRVVKKLDSGVETVTESDSPAVAKKIQEHVPAMYERLKKRNPVRHWDPLFVELFRDAGKVKMDIEMTPKGVKVRETSTDAKVVKLIQAHADVVTKFVEKGFEEARLSHPVPAIGREK